MELERRALDRSALNEVSRRVLEVFEVRANAALAQFSMSRADDGSWNVEIVLPSPTGIAELDAGMWIDERGTPSIEFGGSHTHADLFEDDEERALDALLTFLDRIVAGRVLVSRSVMFEGAVHAFFVDLDDPYDTKNALDQSLRPLLSWSGRHDVAPGANPHERDRS